MNWNCFRIKWDCGHIYNGCNTQKNPNNDKKCLMFGCAYCDCEQGKLEHYKIKRTLEVKG